VKIYQVDSFADRIFSGNPAGVCILDGPIDERLMQNIAMEMNVSETAFLYKANDGYDLRWFTPEEEVDLCGHATLASAHILWETGILDEGCEAVFHSKSGRLTARKDGDMVMLNFPEEPESYTEVSDELKNALGVPFVYTGRNRMDYIVEVENEYTVRNLKPDFQALKKVCTRGVIVTSRSDDPRFDFVSRFFVPGIGIDEDPVTGSAHCCLGPYWGERLGKTVMNAYQASKRGGVLKVGLEGGRVLISGKAVTVFCAELNI
jgi:PhzF family phenazine biosynthesis protein